MHGAGMLATSLAGLVDPFQILMALGATLAGILIGILPGLSATLGIALFTTLTIKMQPSTAIMVLVCVYVGAIYGGEPHGREPRAAVPAATAAGCRDGNVRAGEGKAGRARAISTTGSVLGSLFGVVCLAMFTPALGEIALKFGAFEFFWLALLGVLMSGSLTGEDPIKGWLMGLLGILLAQVGLDPVHAHPRFTFGWNEMSGGIALIPALVGAFGFAEILIAMSRPAGRPLVQSVDSVLPRLADVFRYWRTILRSGAIGVFMGILPGVGEDMGAWTSYAAAKRASRERALFGKGSVEGLMAAETGDNAAIPGALVPALALGVPGSAPSAVLMAAMIIHGVQPGPMLMVVHPGFIYDVVAITLIATLSILGFGLVMVRPILWVLRVPSAVLMAIVFVLCVLGAYAISGRVFDIWVMVVVGVVCFGLRMRGFPVAPLVLGLVLGDIIDKSLRRGLVLSDGSLEPFFTRPISLGLVLLLLVILLMQLPIVKTLMSRRSAARRARTVEPEQA